jgi:hypothetical protein
MTHNVAAKDSLELGDNSSDLLLGSAGGANVAGEVLSAPLAHKYNREQILRADSALQVHDYNHGSNSYNGTACEKGTIPIALTTADFNAMDDLYGPCGACVSKSNSSISHGDTSTSPLPTSPGGLVHADLVKLKDNSVILLTRDDHSGFIKTAKFFLGKSKSGLQFCWDAIERYYIGNIIMRDSEGVLKESSSVLKDRGILCTYSAPETHEKEMERTWQTVQKKIEVFRSALPFELPAGVDYRQLVFVMFLMTM